MKTTPSGDRCSHCQTRLTESDAACAGCGAVLTHADQLGARRGMPVLAAHRSNILARLALTGDTHEARWDDMQSRFTVPELCDDDAEGGDGAPARWQPVAFAHTHTVANPYAVHAELHSPGQPFVSFVMQHCGRGTLRRLTIQNMSESASPPAMVEVGLSPAEYGEPWLGSVPELQPHEVWTADNICLPLAVSRLREVRETERAQLQIRVRHGDTVVFAEGTEIAVHAYNEWLMQPRNLELTAAFVQSNDRSLAAVIQTAVPHLEELTGARSFSGYQKGLPDYVVAMLAAIHKALAEDLKMSYINPPPSHEGTGQKLQLVAETLKAKAGTCFDLAVLQAALWERIGLAPMVILVPGHAMVGCWLVEPPTRRAAVVNLGRTASETRNFIGLLNQKAIIAVNSVEITSHDEFGKAVANAGAILNQVMAGGGAVRFIDIGAARRATPPVKPLP